MGNSANTRNSERVPQGNFRAVLVERGSAVLSIESEKFSVISPCILCFNENDNFCFEYSDDWIQYVIDFPISAVNSSFTSVSGMSSISKDELSSTARLDYDYLSMFIFRDRGFRGYIRLGPSETTKLRMLINSYVLEMENRPDEYWPCRSRSYLLEMLFLLFRIFQSNDIHKSWSIDDSIAGRVIHYIHSSYHEKITVEDLCSRFYTNRTTLNIQLRTATGCSVIDYVNKTRIEAACFLLRDTKLPVSEVAFRTGFNDAAHFTRIFKKFMRTSPGKYRKITDF